MSGNLGCIGIRTRDRESFAKVLGALAAKAVEDAPARGEYLHLRWTDPGGASVAFHLRGGSVDCVTPFFGPPEGLSRWRVKTGGPALDPECVHCSGADCDILGGDGSTVTRATVQLLHFMPYHEWLREPRDFEMEVVSFAHGAAFYATKERYEEGQRRWWTRAGGEEPKGPDGRPLRFSEDAFVPEGMFGEGRQSVTVRAVALYAGRVERSREVTNAGTGIPFRHVRVRTLPGILDTVLDPEACEGEPVAGSIAFIRGWLVGRPAVPFPKAKKGWWRGMFGK